MEDRDMGKRMRRTSKLRRLVFTVNGQRFRLSGIDPSTTLLEFLRTRTKYRGAKLGCGEGGCEACVVLLSTYDPIHDQVKEYTIRARGLSLLMVFLSSHCLKLKRLSEEIFVGVQDIDQLWMYV